MTNHHRTGKPVVRPRGVFDRHVTVRALLLCASVAASAVPLAAQIAISANDNKLVLVNGVNTVVANPAPDTITILDLGAQPIRVLGEVRAPATVVGPPESVAIAPAGDIALVTAAVKIDPADPTKTVPDDLVTVIDLKATPAAVRATLHAGKGASGVSFNPAGTLALVANRNEGTVSIFTVRGAVVTPAGKLDLGAPDSGPSHVAFTSDGRRALVTRNNDSAISVLGIEGASVENLRRDFGAGYKPYAVEVAGDLAFVGHIGAGSNGGVDTIAVVDLSGPAPRVIDQVAAGITIEGLAVSRDGRYVAATVMNGSNAPTGAPYRHETGRLRIFRVENRTLTPVTEAAIGQWCQGTGWSGDGRTVLAQCMMDREIRVFRFDGRALTAAGTVKVNGGPAGLRVAP